jgi:hypothetical protein
MGRVVGRRAGRRVDRLADDISGDRDPPERNGAFWLACRTVLSTTDQPRDATTRSQDDIVRDTRLQRTRAVSPISPVRGLRSIGRIQL